MTAAATFWETYHDFQEVLWQLYQQVGIQE